MSRFLWFSVYYCYIGLSEAYDQLDKKLSYRKLARVGGHYDVQGHSRSFILVLIESLYATFLIFRLVNITNLHPISHRLRDIAQY